MSQNARVTASLTAQTTFSPAIACGSKKKINFSLYGTFSATVSLQRKPLGDADANYRDIATFTAPAEKIVENVGNWVYRWGIRTGNFTSGTAIGDLLY